MKKRHKPKRDLDDALMILAILLFVATWTVIAIKSWPAVRQWLSR